MSSLCLSLSQHYMDIETQIAPYGLTAESRRASAVEVGDLVDAGGSVLAGTGPAFVPVGLAVLAGEAVLAIAVVVTGAEKIQ